MASQKATCIFRFFQPLVCCTWIIDYLVKVIQHTFVDKRCGIDYVNMVGALKINYCNQQTTEMQFHITIISNRKQLCHEFVYVPVHLQCRLTKKIIQSQTEWTKSMIDVLAMRVLILRKKLNVDSHILVTVCMIMYFFYILCGYN